MRGKKGSSPGWNLMPSKRDGQFVLKYKAVSGEWKHHRIPKEIQTKKEALTYAPTWYAEYLADPTPGSAKAVKPTEQPLPPPPAPPPTPADFYDRWSELRQRRFESGKIELSTRDQDKSHWKVHIRPSLGHISLDEMVEKPSILREFIRTLNEKRLAPYTVRNIWSTVKQMFDDIDAEDWHRMNRNPARHPKVVEELPPPRKLAGKNVIIRVPPGDIEKLLKNPAVQVEHKLWYTLAFTTGLRAGELFGLKVGRVNLNETAPSIAIRKALAYRGRNGTNTEQQLKTEDSLRDLPLHPLAAEALRWWLDSCWERHVGHRPEADDFVFPNAEGKGHRPSVAAALRADLVRSGCPDKFETHSITFHATRRSFSTMASEHPEAAAVKFALMGHSPPDVDSAHYNARNEERKRRVVASIALNVTLADIKGESTPTPAQPSAGAADGPRATSSPEAEQTPDHAP